MRKAAIVILNYNGEEMLKTFLPSVVSGSEFDIWVIDNASTDSSIQLLNSKFPNVQTILLKENFGYAGGYNWGLEELKGKYKYYILLNSDVEAVPGWDLDLIEVLESDSDLAAVQPKILSYQDKSKFDYAGAGGGFLDSLYYPYCRGRIWNTVEEDHGQYDNPIDVDWASGACFAIRADLFHQQEGFDAHFFAHMEEIDLCWRMRKAGWKIGYTGKSVVYHLGGATLDRSSPRKLYLNIRNSLSMIFKNAPKSRFALVYIPKFVLEYMAAFSYFLKGQRPLAKAIVRGYWDFWTSRKLIEKNPIVPKHGFEVEKTGPVRFVFFNHLILRKRNFSDL
ncbi:glycosyltransferase family 2 protein [Algoriphagus sp. CAU 1675]|uniref:glycosyltransferase family 2 protein n=1 Tax=Algoriphagus sp. CAU 1675 TaxID=3032597 RepID=UPI0023DCA8CC|nr:glycosyltransferase family 2 protein [Algoriphagus sp. CAU 1675]MDF2157462.1 glycosyltransferase family 2 protein [Algoriphagus sp. CAU 1675]